MVQHLPPCPCVKITEIGGMSQNGGGTPQACRCSVGNETWNEPQIPEQRKPTSKEIEVATNGNANRCSKPKFVVCRFGVSSVPRSHARMGRAWQQHRLRRQLLRILVEGAKGIRISGPQLQGLRAPRQVVFISFGEANPLALSICFSAG